MKHYMTKAIISILIASIAIFGLIGCDLNLISVYHYSDWENYKAGNAESLKAENIEIDWVDGNITVKPHSLDTINIYETAKNLTDEKRVHYWLDDTTLRIKFCANEQNIRRLKKNLTVSIPKSIKNLKVNSVSADVRLENVDAERITVDTVSGRIDLIDCVAEQSVKVNTVSGMTNAEFSDSLSEFKGDSVSGKFNVKLFSVYRFKVDTVSGSVVLNAQKEPDDLSIDTISGNIDLIFPGDASFTLDFDTISGKLNSEINCKSNDGNYIFGDGLKDYAISTVSGNVEITNR